MARKWTDDEILEAIRDLAKAAEDGIVLKKANQKLGHVASYRFGSWTEACKQAGVKCLAKSQNKKTQNKKTKAFQDLTKTDCLLYDKANGECMGLSKLICQKKACSFYKKATRAEKMEYDKVYGGMI